MEEDNNPLLFESSESENECDNNCEENEDDYLSTERSKRSDSVTLVLPSKELTRMTSQVADRTQLSIRNHVAIQAKIINIGDSSVCDFSLSASTVWRHRRSNREELAQKIEENRSHQSFQLFTGIPNYSSIYPEDKMSVLLYLLVVGLNWFFRNYLVYR